MGGSSKEKRMKKKAQKLTLSKETLQNLEAAQVAGAGGPGGVDAIDPITYWPEQCTGASCVNC
jgi:hypothetical protein